MSFIRFNKLVKEFNGVPAVKGIDLEINKGEFVTFLGPSGCGKTTTLRCLSGLELPENGEIWVGEKCIFSRKEGINLPAGIRGLGLVFQNYALWPHMTVEQNVGFALRKKKISPAEKREKIVNVLKAMDLCEYESRFPHELSGGQQQRVALARMVVNEPGILLFDEPLSNLDAKLRMKLRSELKRLHKQLEATSIYVTHDQVEALALSDKIVVMKDGTIQQIGTPYEVYHYPVNLFVADFMGNPETNLIKVKPAPGKTFIPAEESQCSFQYEGDISASAGKEVVLNVRPEDVEINSAPGGNFFIYTIQPMGSEVMVHLKSISRNLDVIVKGPEENFLKFSIEEKVDMTVRRGNIYSSESGEILESFKDKK